MDTTETRKAYSLTLGDRGSLVLPAEVREQLEVDPGIRLILILRDKELRIVSAREQIRRISGMFRHVSPGVSMVDELIAERRAEAARENQERRTPRPPWFSMPLPCSSSCTGNRASKSSGR